MPALNANILYLFFDSTNMHRWNDHLSPIDLTELDKQAHKSMISWILAKYEEQSGRDIDWRMLIEHQMFSFIQRSVLTDLKPQVFHKVVKEKRDQVNAFVLSEFDRMVPNTDPSFRKRFSEYLASEMDAKEDEIIRAAHYLATRWEFDLIYESNRSMYKIDDTRREIEEQIYQHADLEGVKKILSSNKDVLDFIDLFGQLRFQQRWARTPRIPKTTVLGHSLIVANMMFLHDLDMNIEDQQLYNDYYTGLFHDLPEVLTRDVITPIKTNVSGLADILKDYEEEQVEATIMPLLEESWRDGFRFMVYEPFSDVAEGRYGPRDGYDLKSCDMMCAYMEAYISIRYGISSATLINGEKSIRSKLLERGEGIDAERLIYELSSMEL